jgi:hypothetical protein
MRVNCLKILRKNGKNDARNSLAIFCAHFYRFYLSFQPFNPLTTKLNSKEVYFLTEQVWRLFVAAKHLVIWLFQLKNLECNFSKLVDL